MAAAAHKSFLTFCGRGLQLTTEDRRPTTALSDFVGFAADSGIVYHCWLSADLASDAYRRHPRRRLVILQQVLLADIAWR